jgi:hypothetical protein
MKRDIIAIELCILMTVFMVSCKTVQVAKFASVEDVMDLKINSSLDEVISKLGSKPYNIHSSQDEGYTIYTYKYKLVERRINPLIVNSSGGETAGTEVYNGKEQILFLVFREGKLESLITSEGRKDSDAVLILNNTIYTISRDKGKYVIIPTTLDEEEGQLQPMLGAKKNKFWLF